MVGVTNTLYFLQIQKIAGQYKWPRIVYRRRPMICSYSFLNTGVGQWYWTKSATKWKHCLRWCSHANPEVFTHISVLLTCLLSPSLQARHSPSMVSLQSVFERKYHTFSRSTTHLIWPSPISPNNNIYGLGPWWTRHNASLFQTGRLVIPAFARAVPSVLWRPS